MATLKGSSPARALRPGFWGSSPRCRQTRAFSRSQQCRAPEEVQGAHKYCVDLLSKYDRPSYTLSSFIPPHARSFYLALRALNVSLALIPETTSSHTIGLMRLQFWRDAVAKILAGSPPKEPVAILLASAISDLHERTEGHARISRSWLTRLISAREQTLTNDPYSSIADLESYAENTYSTLIIAYWKSSGDRGRLTRTAPGCISTTDAPKPPWRRCGQPRAQRWRKTRAVMLPLDVMAQAGVKEEDVLRYGADAEGLRDAVFTVATRASDHLITVEQMLTNLRAGKDVGHDFEHAGEEGHEYDSYVSRESPLDEVNRAFGVFMPAISTRLWLDRLQQYDFDVFRPELLRSDWRLPWKSYLAFRRKSFS
ncbi:hypothetical protein N7470_007218 [Penicillium chermesinum]|nr:hypothetical protein N7470_007218 [Penicillium chermesinum]